MLKRQKLKIIWWIHVHLPGPSVIATPLDATMSVVAPITTVASITAVSPWIIHPSGLVLGFITLLPFALAVVPELKDTVFVAGPLLSCEHVPSIELA